MPSVKDSYNNGACPDCGEEIDDNAVTGDECPNCGHVFAEACRDCGEELSWTVVETDGTNLENVVACRNPDCPTKE